MKTRFSPSLPLALWPEAHRKAWAAAQEGDPLAPGDGGGVASWRPISVKSAEEGYGQWLDWLKQRGDLDPTSSPASRATVAQVKAYRDDLVSVGYADYTIANRIRELVDVLRACAPGEDFDFLGRAAHRFQEDSRRKTSVRPRMRPAGDIHELGLSLIEQAGDKPASSVRRARLYRDGLIILFWVSLPLRVSNLAGLRVGEELVKVDHRWRVRLSKDQTKNGQPYECWWPPKLLPALEVYLRDVRPFFAARGPDQPRRDHLWLSASGRGMSRNMISYPIRTRTKSAFGVVINPHLIRHIVATEIATYQPENVADVVPILSHSSIKVSEKYYNQSGAARGAMTYAKMIDARGVGKPRARGARWISKS
jgi:integrase